MAYVPPHLLDSASKCRNRVQGDAGAIAAFNFAIHVGRLHSGGHSSEACSAGGGRVISPFFRWELRSTTGRRSRIAEKRAQKGREMRPFRALNGFEGTRLTLLE